MGLLLKHMIALVSEDTKKQLLNAIFYSVFTAELSPQEPQISKVREEGCRKEGFPLVEWDWVTGYLGRLNTHKHPWALMGSTHGC